MLLLKLKGIGTMNTKITQSILIIIMPTLALAQTPQAPSLATQPKFQEKPAERPLPFKLETLDKETKKIIGAPFKSEMMKFDLLMKSSGTNSGGGGDSVIDPVTGKKKLLDLAEVDEWPQIHFIPLSKQYLKKYSQSVFEDLEHGYFLSLNYYWTNDILYPQIQIFAGIAAAGLIAGLSDTDVPGPYRGLKERLISAGLGEIQKSLDQRIKKNGRVMRWVFVDFPLEEIDDEGVIRLIDASTKKQLAAQKDGIVAIQKQEFDLLDSESQAALFLHEAFLFSTLTLKPDALKEDGTSNLRLFVKRFFNYENLFVNFYNDRNTTDEATLMHFHRSIEDAYKKLMKINTKE